MHGGGQVEHVRIVGAHRAKARRELEHVLGVRAGRPDGAGGATSPGRAGTGEGSAEGGRGTSNQNVEPVPSELSTPIMPPIASTMSFEMARPRPEPPKRRTTELSP